MLPREIHTMSVFCTNWLDYDKPFLKNDNFKMSWQRPTYIFYLYMHFKFNFGCQVSDIIVTRQTGYVFVIGKFGLSNCF